MVTNTEAKARGIPRTAAYIDVGEMISGALLFIFVFFHLALVFTVVLGTNGDVFDKVAKWLEDTYLAHLALAGVAILILLHVILVISRVPVRWQDHVAVWRLGNRMKHFDTMLWFLQAGSGFLIFAFGFAHLWNIFADLPIEAAKSAASNQAGFIWFFIPFLLLIAIHVSAGFYRIMIKWDFIPRKVAIPLSWFLYIFYIAIALLNMSVFMRIPVGGAS
jgi:fumarate reductase subunit C